MSESISSNAKHSYWLPLPLASERGLAGIAIKTSMLVLALIMLIGAIVF